SGMIDFSFLKRIRLKFINGIIQEDDMFGILLFAQCERIYVYSKALYHYRIRANSIMNYGNDFYSKVPGFFAEPTKIFKENYLKRQYHKAASFMQTSLALHDFLENSKDEKLKHIIGKYLMPTYVLIASKILYFPKDPLGLIPSFESLSVYLKDFNLTHLATHITLKESLAYRLGGLTLSLKGKILKLPQVILEMIALDKKMLKAYKTNLKQYNLQMPDLNKLVDKIESIKTKQHLSFQIGSCILTAHRLRYLGGYLWLPFGIAWKFIRFKQNATKHKKDTILLDEMRNLKAQIQHLNHQIWQISRNPQNEDLNAKLQDLGIPREYHNAFLSLRKGTKALSFSKDTRFVEMFLGLGARIYHYEPDLLVYERLKAHFGDSIYLYNKGLASEQSSQTLLRDTRGNGNAPSIYYAGNHAFKAEFARIDSVVLEMGGVDCFFFELNFESYALLQFLISSNILENIGFVCAKVDWEFKESRAFKNLLEEVDSKATKITPPPARGYFIL
ncbi:MAG: hypothetical protein NC548_64570, partial [Lachnospiraceae bacterium]|nr:hypothetical protein [Lachnospiraceae bacterium]